MSGLYDIFHGLDPDDDWRVAFVQIYERPNGNLWFVKCRNGTRISDETFTDVESARAVASAYNAKLPPVDTNA